MSSRSRATGSPASGASPEDILLPKEHPSAFFGTPLASYLIDSGSTPSSSRCSTSGCVRGTVVDGSPTTSRSTCPRRGVRPQRPVHEVNLFDMGQKYADVMTTDDVLAKLEAIAGSS